MNERRVIVYYYRNKYDKRIYENLTQRDRIILRDCRNKKRKLTQKEKIEIFGSENPIFVEIF